MTVPRLRLQPRIRAELVALARHESPAEACGILVGRAGDEPLVQRVIRGPNRHPDPHTGFELDAGFVRWALQRLGPRLLGFWHSHPRAGAGASRADRIAAWPGHWMVIVGLGGARPRLRAHGWSSRGRLVEGLLVERGTG